LYEPRESTYRRDRRLATVGDGHDEEGNVHRLPESPNSAASRIRAFIPELDGVSEVFHASFADHAYPPHCHDSWTVLIIDDGAVSYDIHRHARGADTRRVTILPPFVAHDGRSARPGRGFRKRVLYIAADTIGENLVGAAVDDSTLDDRTLRCYISDLHLAFDLPRDDLEWETRLGIIVSRIRRHLAKSSPDQRPNRGAAEALRDYLDSRLFERHRLDHVATALGWNPTHLIRSFSAAFGIPPHRYLISRRIDQARRRLLAGQPAAQVAVDVGFFDQAHLNRHFRSHLATTPGRYQKSGASTKFR
jgi:AraC-like DNA-binding protein